MGLCPAELMRAGGHQAACATAMARALLRIG